MLIKILVLILVIVSNVCTEKSDVCPKIISKSRWGGRDAVNITYTIIPVNYVIIHHTVTPTCLEEESCSSSLINMQSDHFSRDFDDIGYNFLIGGDGNVYQGAGWHKQGAHTYGYNRKSVGIAFIGDFSSITPNATQLEAGKKLIECGVSLGEISPNYKLLGARSVIATQSPGMGLFREMQEWKGFTRKP